VFSINQPNFDITSIRVFYLKIIVIDFSWTIFPARQNSAVAADCSFSWPFVCSFFVERALFRTWFHRSLSVQIIVRNLLARVTCVGVSDNCGGDPWSSSMQMIMVWRACGGGWCEIWSTCRWLTGWPKTANKTGNKYDIFIIIVSKELV